MSAEKIPRLRKRRASRIRTELGLWLSQNAGRSGRYSKLQIDRGREELGFTGLDDALVAYSLFGANLLPDFLSLQGLSDYQAEIEAEIDAVVDAAGLGILDDGAV